MKITKNVNWKIMSDGLGQTIGKVYIHKGWDEWVFEPIESPLKLNELEEIVDKMSRIVISEEKDHKNNTEAYKLHYNTKDNYWSFKPQILGKDYDIEELKEIIKKLKKKRNEPLEPHRPQVIPPPLPLRKEGSDIMIYFKFIWREGDYYEISEKQGVTTVGYIRKLKEGLEWYFDPTATNDFHLNEDHLNEIAEYIKAIKTGKWQKIVKATSNS